MKSSFAKLGLTLVITHSFFISGCELLEKREAVRSDLSALCNSFPVPTEFQKLDEGGVIKPERGSITIDYGTDSECRNARSVFYDYWKKNGWKPTAPDSAYYFKENYIVTSSCQSARFFDDKKIMVRVTCGWDSTGEDKDFYK